MDYNDGFGGMAPPPQKKIELVHPDTPWTWHQDISKPNGWFMRVSHYPTHIPHDSLNMYVWLLCHIVDINIHY